MDRVDTVSGDLANSNDIRPLRHWISKHARSRPDRIALVGEDFRGKRQQLCWSELLPAIASEAERRYRDVIDNRLIVQSDNSIGDVLALLAAMDRRWVHCPIDARLPDRIKQQRRAVLLSRTPHAGTQFVLWTSGTSVAGGTGGESPMSIGRAVCHREQTFWHNAAAKLAKVPQTVDDVRLTVLPICHAYGRTCDIGTWLLSGCRLVVDLGGNAIDRYAAEQSITLINMVPKLTSRLLAGPAIGSLRAVGVGGACLDPSTFQQLIDRGHDVVQGYGLTETGPVICSATPTDAVAGSVGGVVRGWTTRIVDQELSVTGPDLMLGYLDGPRLQPGQFFCTGDRVEVSDRGQYRILGRTDDQITLPNGYTIDPVAIEQEFERTHPGLGPVMMTDRSEIWVSAPTPIDRWRSTTQPSAGWFRVVPHDPPLGCIEGEATIKGTLRRAVVRRRT